MQIGRLLRASFTSRQCVANVQGPSPKLRRYQPHLYKGKWATKAYYIKTISYGALISVFTYWLYLFRFPTPDMRYDWLVYLNDIESRMASAEHSQFIKQVKTPEKEPNNGSADSSVVMTPAF